MNGRTTRWLIGAFALFAILAVHATPADAAPPPFPMRYSITVHNVVGALIECIDFVPCNLAECPADLFFAGRRCSYDRVTGDFELARTRTTIECPLNTLWFESFIGVFPVRTLILDVTCSRWGTAFWFWGPVGFPGPGSCAVEASLKRIFPNSANFTRSDGYGGVTIAGWAGNFGKCANVFGFSADQEGPLPLPSPNTRRR